jgi:hypothetical protein
MLKEEIGESTLRLKFAKIGHSLQKIIPQHDSSFYLPESIKPKPAKVPKTSS